MPSMPISVVTNGKISSLKKKKIYLFIHERHTQRDRDRNTGRGRSRLHARSLMWDSIPGPQDHALGQRQALNR